MGKLLPVILLVLGGAIGGGAGFFMKPASEPDCAVAEASSEECGTTEMDVADEVEDDGEEKYYVAMKNQFVVPVIRNELVQSLVVLSLSLETTPDSGETLFSKEPKMRDAFLRVLFDHAHIGGFNGAFTESSRLSILRVALLEAAQSVVGGIVSDVLITDIVRQEM